ncbi:MAG: MFS transporter [candidate division WS1 bacterium]|jgi:MFS family permease|nr:MFS transporter [candidate division WS1 bacterium]
MSQPMPQTSTTQLSRRNFKVGVINGAFWLLARALTDPDTVLPAFAVALMGDNPIYVGLLVSLVSAGWFWPPLLMTTTMATRRDRHVYYKVSAIIRLLSVVGLWAAARYLAPERPALAFVAVSVSYLAFTSGGGIGLIPFMSVVTDSITASRRGRFFAMRFFFGGLMAFGAGFWIRWLLSEDSGLAFPANYAYLFLVAAIVAAVSLVAWWVAWEPAHKIETRALPLRIQLLRGLRRLRRLPVFRRLVGTRLMMSASYGLVVPFLIPYAYENLGMVEAMVGVALASRVLCYSMFNILWSRVSSRYGNRMLLITSGVLHLLAILMALMTPLLPPVQTGQLLGLEFSLPLIVLMIIFGALGAADSGQQTGQSAYLLEYAPERTRPVYLATYYLLALPVSFMPLATALLIGQAGRYSLVFGLGLLAAAINVVLYTRLVRLDGDEATEAPSS